MMVYLDDSEEQDAAMSAYLRRANGLYNHAPRNFEGCGKGSLAEPPEVKEGCVLVYGGGAWQDSESKWALERVKSKLMFHTWNEDYFYYESVEGRVKVNRHNFRVDWDLVVPEAEKP